MKHTPGPWVNDPCSMVTGYFITTDRNLIIAEVLPSSRVSVHANAKLIAAAPDLLDALLDMVSDHENLSPATIENARKAIEKAVTW